MQQQLTRYNHNALLPTAKRALSLVCLLATGLLSQDGLTFRSKVETVVVPCTVVNASGVAVGDLTRDEFRVFDNNVRRPIQSLWVDADQPLILGVIIDASESQKEHLSEHRQTATELLQRILRPGDRAFVISVDEDVRLWDLTNASTDFSSRLAQSTGSPFGEGCSRRSIAIPGLGPRSGCGSSPLWNTIYDAARIKMQPTTGNKALLILTDGFDSGSNHTWSQTADAVTRADASLYAIQYRSGFGGSLALDLYKLVRETGGTRFNPPNGAYSQIVSRMETDLRRRYVLGFRPDRLSAGRKHEIRIEVTRPDLSVRTRKTYFQDPL
jgi:VWFA-related protein